MKKNTVLLLFFVTVIIYTLSGCDSKKPQLPYTDSQSRIGDSIYKANADTISRLMGRLIWLEQLPDLAKPMQIIDSTGDITGISIIKGQTIESTCLDSAVLTVHNCIVINNRTNLTLFNGDDSLRKNAATNYFISAFVKDREPVTDIMPVTLIPAYWFYYNHYGYRAKGADSLYQDEIPSFIGKETKELASLHEIKYAVVLNDEITAFPKLIDTKTFESGFMISQVKVYDLDLHRLLCTGMLGTQSSDEVAHALLNSGGGELSLKKVLPNLLYQDFCDQRNKKLISFLRLK